MEERRQTQTSTRRRAWRSSDEPEPKHLCPDLAAVPTRGTSARAFAGPGLDPRRTSINRIHPGLDPPLDPPYLGLRPLQNVTRSYLALSVTWAGPASSSPTTTVFATIAGRPSTPLREHTTTERETNGAAETSPPPRSVGRSVGAVDNNHWGRSRTEPGGEV